MVDFQTSEIRQTGDISQDFGIKYSVLEAERLFRGTRLNFVNYGATKMFLFFKYIGISPEIYWYGYLGASRAHLATIWQ